MRTVGTVLDSGRAVSAQVGVAPGPVRRAGRRLGWIRTLTAGILLALVAMWVFGFVAFLARATRGSYEIVDFHFYYTAAQAVLHGRSPYLALDDPTLGTKIAYVYPPLTAIVTTPFTLLPLHAAGALAVSLLAVTVVSTLYVLGVRDWRCYVLALSWRPVLFAILTGNLTVVLGLAAALAWRFRDRLLPVVSAVGLALAAKLFLWPLVVWLAATRRYAAALLSCFLAVVVVLGSWAVIGFAGLLDYPRLLRRAQELQEHATYTTYSLARDLGLPATLARGLGSVVALALLAGVVLLSRRGASREAFVLAVAASIGFSPIVWLHYFALLVVVVGVSRPTLGAAWFLPLAMWVAPGVDGTPAAKIVVLAAAALIMLVCVLPRRDSRTGYRRVRLDRMSVVHGSHT